MYVYASKTEKCVRAVWACSLNAAGGGAGLVEPHGFAQPAGKIHLLHLRSLDECMTLKASQKANHCFARIINTETGHQISRYMKMKVRYAPSASSDLLSQLGF